MSMPITTETILIEFARAVKAAQFYPEGHPNLEAITEKAFIMLKDVIRERGDIKWTVERTHFLEGKVEIGRKIERIEELAKDLFFKRIKGIAFTKDATLKELRDLLSILKMDDDSLRKAGGIEKLLVDNEIRGILLNEMKYEEIRKKLIELEEKKKREAEIEEEEKRAAAAKQEKISPTLVEQLEEVKEEEETLESLLNRLEQETETAAYREIANKIIKKAKPLLDERKWDELFPALIIFIAHSNSGSNRPNEQKTIASNGLKELLHSEIIDYLIIRLCNRSEERHDEIQQMLLLLGEDAMNRLLATLIEIDSAHIRRQLFNTLATFGERVRSEAEKRLHDTRWFVVRQMVSLLGEIGSSRSLSAITGVFGHKDVRVKKEVLKAVARIPSNESVSFLLKNLSRQNTSLKLQAIISLGVLKNPAALESLGKLASKRGIFDRNIEIRKEAVRSIGMIGGDKASALLGNILRKQVLCGRKHNDEVRCIAAISLGKIGGKDALETLKEAYESATGLVRLACEKAMEEMRQDSNKPK